MPWLAGNPFFIQQDGARPHTANGTIKDLEASGTGDGFIPIIVTQPPNSPDLNFNDLGFFASLKVDVKRICTSREEMMANVILDLVKVIPPLYH
jgi:transposase